MSSARKILPLLLVGFVLIAGLGWLYFTLDFSPSQPARQTRETLSPRVMADLVTHESQSGVRDLYAARNFQPLWIRGERLSPDAKAVLALLAHAGDEGLPATRYLVKPAPTHDARALARFDLRLTEASLAYQHDVSLGLLKPQSTFPDVELPKSPALSPADLAKAADDGKAADYLKSQAPAVPQYLALKAALPRYRAMAAHPWPQVARGEGNALSARLMAEGYLTAGASQADVAAALRQYQDANGLPDNAGLDEKTIAALNIPASQRVQQIEANLERWRWLPRDLGERYIMVNVPGATLSLMEDGNEALSSRVVVGAPDKPTPILATRAIAVTVNPIWHVPQSIVKKEIQPKLDANPDYLESKDMERTDKGEIIQHPGPQNALGTLKFNMPNSFDVYLHDTPSKRAFTSDDRALSHGCVRVEQVKALVERLLGLSDSDLTNLISSGQTGDKPLKPALPVYIAYWTAVPAGNGAIGFRDDIYGRDTIMAPLLSGANMKIAAN